MGLLKNHKKAERNSVVIVGCGRLGGSLASALSEKGDTVVIIDRDKDSFRKLSPSYGGLSIIGNAGNLAILEEAKIDENTTVVCVTNNDNFNIMIAEMAHSIYGAGRVITRLINPEKSWVYEDLGIETICPTELSSKAINRLIKVST